MSQPYVYKQARPPALPSSYALQHRLKTAASRPTSSSSSSSSSKSSSSSRPPLSSDPSSLREAGNVRVVVRLRPLNAGEKERGDDVGVWAEQDGYTVSVVNDSKAYGFDTVLNDESSQELVFEKVGVAQLLQDALEGFNGSVLAYGQTGSGKTFTMCGPEGSSIASSLGIIPRAAQTLFSALPPQTRVHCSFLEVYNEKVNDLLDVQATNLPIRWRKGRGFYAEGLIVVECTSLEDMSAVLTEGITNRKVASHELNKDSSRSHSIFSMYLERTLPDGSRMTGRVDFVDLAGSERLKESQATGDTATETMHINKSLLTLAKVITALSSTTPSPHIPYRESKLTMLLNDSLGGNARTIMVRDSSCM